MKFSKKQDVCAMTWESLKVTEEEMKKIKQTVDYFKYWYDELTEKDKQIAELEKENAELKEKVNILDNCDRLGDMITEAYKDQLTKAKEIIREFVEWATWQGSNCPNFKSIQDKAEQFLEK